jgi:hypothetical protein
LYIIVGRPLNKAFEEMLKGGKLVNNSVTVQDYKNALRMYGVDLGVLNWKTTQSKTEHVKIQFLEKPKPVNIILSVNLMSFTGFIFLTTVSRNIRFVTATLIQDRKKNTIMSALNQVIKIYHGKGHVVQDMEFEEIERPIHTLLADNEFQALKDDLEEMGMNVHVVTKNEHVPEIERQNWVIKERARGIMGAQVLDSNLICKVPFCAYAQVHDDNDITNTMKQRTTGGINLGPSNMRGEYRFLSLETGEILVKEMDGTSSTE